jgi:hypothetical protein
MKEMTVKTIFLAATFAIGAMLTATTGAQAGGVTVTKTTRTVNHHYVTPVHDDRHGCYTKKVKVYHNGTYVWKTKRVCT